MDSRAGQFTFLVKRPSADKIEYPKRLVHCDTSGPKIPVLGPLRLVLSKQ